MCIHVDERPYADVSQWGKCRAFQQVWHAPQNQPHHVSLDLFSGSRGCVAGKCNASGEEEELFSTSSHTHITTRPPQPPLLQSFGIRGWEVWLYFPQINKTSNVLPDDWAQRYSVIFSLSECLGDEREPGENTLCLTHRNTES